VLLPPPGDEWVALSAEALELGELATWAVLPTCGAVVVFAGTVREHAEGRPGVISLEYEAYTTVALKKMEAIARELRRRWPVVGRVAMVHRTGLLVPAEVSVVGSVSAPHRSEAFDAARFGIDALKAGVPIWKRETWEGGSAWGLDAHPVDGSSVPDLSEDKHVSRLGS
jgi:molybdopterin synthase catalytic subunit